MTYATVAHAEMYTLVTDDKIKLRVVEWRSSDTKYAGWEALEGTYAVDDTGNLSIPIAGQIKATGKTTEQIADAIAGAIAEKAELPGKPFVAVEVAEHAPIFVTGTVQTPGRYPFQANMTVMKAVSIAGGFLRASEGNAAYFERDRIQAAGAYRTARLGRRDLLMQQARLRAEIASEPDFAIPAELVGTPGVEKLKAEEFNLMRLRRVESESQVAAADDLSRLYSQEIQSLEAKISSQTRQIALAQEELDAVKSLASKGLSNNARQFSLDRALADAQSGMLDLEIALTKARQALSDSEREKAGIINKQNAENQQLLNATELAIAKAAVEMQVAQLLGEHAGYSAELAHIGTERTNLGRTQKSFKIVRRSDDGTYRNFEANETTALMPHDLIEIGADADAQASSLLPQSPASPALSPNLTGQGSSPSPHKISSMSAGGGGHD
ncbi:polysaccharide biosynthesis/export family protein (plasmid) [Phyllobacterium sp. A18/5-2]|uniref:polysaccharide biosynthesis/export family protein n=1 Tax=Phyllobacterium sp. A18/5-2 TaxID=2978392 RepID=UPI0021C9A067|nr:polysaccharide biosynthesis/export family protein [Phyllobacterium sp. A18/5-2]UXN66281.1 polysaccharide biosynthesis/export family protein [Phyllobacterium sp. A18/5-2]